MQGSVGIAADHVGHDAGVRNAQFAYANDPELRIDNATDPAGAGQVHAYRKIQREILQKSVARGGTLPAPVLLSEERGDHQGSDLAVRRPVRHDVQGPAQHREHHLHVVGVSEIIHADGRMGGGVAAFEDDLAFAVRQHRIRQHDHAFRVGSQTLGRVVEILRRVHVQVRMPKLGGEPTGNETNLRVVTVVVAEVARKPGTRIVQGRRHQAAPSRFPLAEPPLCFLLQSLEIGLQVAIFPGIRGQRTGGLAKRLRSHRKGDFTHRDAGSGSREEQWNLHVILQVLAFGACEKLPISTFQN